MTIEARGAAAAAPPAPRYRDQLAAICAQLGAAPSDAERIISAGCLRLDGVDFAVRLDAGRQQIEFYGDCGRPAPTLAHGVYQHVLEEALTNDAPALVIGLHSQSGHLVAKCAFHLPSLDPQGCICAAALMLAVTRVKRLRERFRLEPMSTDDVRPGD